MKVGLTRTCAPETVSAKRSAPTCSPARDGLAYVKEGGREERARGAEGIAVVPPVWKTPSRGLRRVPR